MPHGALVFTTIYDNPILEAYYANLAAYGRLEALDVYLIPDRKTPPGVLARCREMQSRGLRVTCPNLEEQETFLSKVGFSPDMVPYNSDNRRNVGYLMALAAGVDFIISLDDDNYCREGEDFWATHAVVCRDDLEVEEVATASGWYNICELLTFDRSGPVYPRGFPYYARHRQEAVTRTRSRRHIHLNAGLWLQAPDVDGISWLVNPMWSQDMQGESITLAPGVYSPVNTQNTALRAEAMAAFYYIRMNYPLGGLPIDRYGDIFAGYFVQACMHHLGGTLRVGTPLAEHRRHSHNYLNDALREMVCLALMEDILPWLTAVELTGATYPEAYTCLSHLLEDAVEKFQGPLWTDSTRGYFHQTAYCMRRWAKVCQSLLGL